MTASGAGMSDPRSKLRFLADDLISQLRTQTGSTVVPSAKRIIADLREYREFERLSRLAEEVSRHEPNNPTIRRHYAQSLIETGRATAAIDILRMLARRESRSRPEWAEARGLLGRAYKQIFFDSRDKDGPVGSEALREAVAHYRAPYEQDPLRNAWHGVNLVALLIRARTLGVRCALDLDPVQLAGEIVATMHRTPPDSRDNWYHASIAEAHLALGQWDEAQQHLGRYVRDGRTTAFNLGSTLRQFIEVWGMEAADGSDRGRAIVSALRARTLAIAGENGSGGSEPGGSFRIEPEQLQRATREAEPSPALLQALLGSSGPKTYRWWRAGLERARGVASIRMDMVGRFGTGFLLRGGDLLPALGDEVMVLTNWHVVNTQGIGGAAPLETVEVVFEADGSDKAYRVLEIVWSSPADRHDATLLRLASAPRDIPPIPLARALPDISAAQKPRVYAIGHPGGRELSFSFQDNELIDHEGAPLGTPTNADVCRLHYRTPTEPGSSGSPVFNGSNWQVLALHHAGGRDICRLNGQSGVWDANEGVSLACIAATMERELA